MNQPIKKYEKPRVKNGPGIPILVNIKLKNNGRPVNVVGINRIISNHSLVVDPNIQSIRLIIEGMILLDNLIISSRVYIQIRSCKNHR